MSETTVTMTTAEMANQLHAKVPKDHKPRKVDDKEAMALANEALSGVITVTVNGVTWDVDKAAFNDFRLMYSASKGDIMPMFNALVPDGEAVEKLFKTIALPDGRVPVDQMAALLEKISERVGMGK